MNEELKALNDLRASVRECVANSAALEVNSESLFVAYKAIKNVLQIKDILSIYDNYIEYIKLLSSVKDALLQSEDYNDKIKIDRIIIKRAMKCLSFIISVKNIYQLEICDYNIKNERSIFKESEDSNIIKDDANDK